jgi:hydrogenase maturation protease
MTASGTATPCRVLVGAFGRPGMRDLDFGRQVVDYLQELTWPDGVMVEDLSCAAPLVLHRLQELRPAKVVLLGAVARAFDPPATLRRYRLDLTPPPPDAVHRRLEESVMGMVDLDHTLAIARHWGGLPADTVIIEVEPAEAGFGLGFSDALAGCFDPILDMVREELGDLAVGAGQHRDLEDEEVSALHAGTETEVLRSVLPSDGMTQLVEYARDHARACQQRDRSPALLDGAWSDAHGVTIAGRVRPWGVFVESGGDWFDAVPLDGDMLGIVVGNVAGRGVEVAPTMSDLRAAARAYAAIDGDSPVPALGPAGSEDRVGAPGARPVPDRAARQRRGPLLPCRRLPSAAHRPWFVERPLCRSRRIGSRRGQRRLPPTGGGRATGSGLDAPTLHRRAGREQGRCPGRGAATTRE